MLVIRGKKVNNYGVLEYNKIYLALELIGLFDMYEGSEEEFRHFYDSRISEGNRRYYYRNKGVNIIYDILTLEGTLESNPQLHVSKRSMRRSGVSKRRVIVYQGTEVFVARIIKYFEDNQFLGDFYFERIHNNEVSKYLLFQSDFIDEYTLTHHGIRANYFNEMKETIRGIINV